MTTTQVRSSRPVRALLASLILMVALISVAEVAVPIAHADAVDTNFLAALKSKGVNFASALSAIIAGHEVCDELDLGRQASDVATEVTRNSDLDDYHAGFFVGASIGAFCPRHTS